MHAHTRAHTHTHTQPSIHYSVPHPPLTPITPLTYPPTAPINTHAHTHTHVQRCIALALHIFVPYDFAAAKSGLAPGWILSRFAVNYTVVRGREKASNARA